jgi:hypothetical protein
MIIIWLDIFYRYLLHKMAKNAQAEERAIEHGQTSAMQLAPCERNPVFFPLLLYIVNLERIRERVS